MRHTPRELLAASIAIAGALGFSVHAAITEDDDSAHAPSTASPTAIAPPQSSDIIHPIYYPHSPMQRRDQSFGDDDVNELLDQFMHLHTAMRYEEALKVIEQLIALRPANNVMHYNHACVLARLYRTDASIDALERAVQHGWQNLSHIQVDPDLQAVRWSERYSALSQELAAAIQHEQPSPRPLRVESWQPIVRDLETLAPSLLQRNDLQRVTIALVHDREHVWTGTFTRPADDAPHVRDEAHQQTHRVQAPVQLLAMLGVLGGEDPAEQPGVLQLVKLIRHAAEVEPAGSAAAGRIAGSRKNDSAGAFANNARRTISRNRRVPGAGVLRIDHVPDVVHDLLRLAVEYRHGSTFIRDAHERALPLIGMNDSRLIVIRETFTSGSDVLPAGLPSVARDRARSHRAIQQTSTASRHTAAEQADGQPLDRLAGRRRLVMDTTADDLAALLTHVLRMQRSREQQTMNWQQISDLLLRSCATRTLSIGSGITITRTPFGVRTNLICSGRDPGSEVPASELQSGERDLVLMRWYPDAGIGMVALFDSHTTATRRTAELLAHHVLGGEP